MSQGRALPVVSLGDFQVEPLFSEDFYPFETTSLFPELTGIECEQLSQFSLFSFEPVTEEELVEESASEKLPGEQLIDLLSGFVEKLKRKADAEAYLNSHQLLQDWYKGEKVQFNNEEINISAIELFEITKLALQKCENWFVEWLINNNVIFKKMQIAHEFFNLNQLVGLLQLAEKSQEKKWVNVLLENDSLLNFIKEKLCVKSSKLFKLTAAIISQQLNSPSSSSSATPAQNLSGNWSGMFSMEEIAKSAEAGKCCLGGRTNNLSHADNWSNMFSTLKIEKIAESKTCHIVEVNAASRRKNQP